MKEIITKLARIKKVILDHKILNNSFDIQCTFTKSWELWIHFLFLKNYYQNQCWKNSKKTQSEWIMKHLYTKIKPWFKVISTLINIATIWVFMEELNFQNIGIMGCLDKKSRCENYQRQPQNCNNYGEHGCWFCECL